VYQGSKRICDFLVALVLLLLLSPILIPIVIGLRFTGEGEIFYKQNRVGFKQKNFGILKFATMLKDSPNIGTGDITLRNDPRVTPMGGWLRKTKINELPQILNVLLGDLSLVGPRPLMPVSFEMYTDEVKAIIYESRPGITGIGSLVYRDEEALVSAVTDGGADPRAYYQDAIYPYKGQLESWYYKNNGFLTDFKILLGTALSLVNSDKNWAKSFFSDLPTRPDNLEPSRFIELTRLS